MGTQQLVLTMQRVIGSVHSWQRSMWTHSGKTESRHVRAGTADGEVARRYRVLAMPPTIPRGCQPPSAKLSGSWHCTNRERSLVACKRADHCVAYQHRLAWQGPLRRQHNSAMITWGKTPCCWLPAERCQCTSAAWVSTTTYSSAHLFRRCAHGMMPDWRAPSTQTWKSMPWRRSQQ
jgi:hypothetical protein